MNVLANRHPGQKAIIVGCGPSITDLRYKDFPAGIVIAINHSILVVRALRLPNHVYSMQKDGCIIHGCNTQVPIDRCICPGTEMVQPVEPEELILTWAESSHCYAAYPLRHVVNVQEDLGLHWTVSSAPTAVKLAAYMGCTSLVMFGHDAYTTGDTGRIHGSAVIEDARAGYIISGQLAQAQAEALGLPVVWQ